MLGFINPFRTRCVTLKLQSPKPLHLRPAAKLAQYTKNLSCKCILRYRKKEANTADVQAILALGIESGDRFELCCKGVGAQNTLLQIGDFLKTLFDQESRIAPCAPLPQDQNPYTQSPLIAIEALTLGIAVAPLQPLAINLHKPQHPHCDVNTALLHLLNQASHTPIAQAQQGLLEALSAASYPTLEALEEHIKKQIQVLKGELKAKQDDYHDILMRIKEQMGYRYEMALPKTQTILIADTLLPSQAQILLEDKYIAGLILRNTSPASHSAIILQDAPFGVALCDESIAPSDQAILDCNASVLVPRPNTDSLKIAHIRLKAHQDNQAQAYAKRFETIYTRQGKPIVIEANITDIDSAKKAKEAGAQGIGLLRTEFMYQTPHPPSFETLTQHFRAIFELFENVTVRTLDFGGDKPLPYAPIPPENNPFLGERGIRLLKRHSDLFETQLRAVFTAAKGGSLKVMFPMIDTPDRFIEAKTFALKTAKRYKLDVSGISFGMMVEVPSVLFEIERYNDLVDFYSVGTNDLTQYLFAIERTHPTLRTPTLSPALKNALAHLLTHANKPISVCGNLAGDPKGAPWLCQIGFDRLSMNPASIPTIKESLRHV